MLTIRDTLFQVCIILLVNFIFLKIIQNYGFGILFINLLIFYRDLLIKKINILARLLVRYGS